MARRNLLVAAIAALLVAGCQRPIVSISRSMGSLDEPDGSVVVTLTRTDSARGTVEAKLAYSGTMSADVDYSGAVGSLLLPPSSATSFTLTAVDDSFPESDEHLVVTILPGDYDIGTRSVTISSADNDEQLPDMPDLEQLARDIKEWKRDLGSDFPFESVGLVYTDAAAGLDSLAIGSIGQAGERISGKLAAIIPQAKLGQWKALADKIDVVYRKHKISQDRAKAILFYMAVGQAIAAKD